MRKLLADKMYKSDAEPESTRELLRARLINQLDTVNAKLIELEQQGIVPNLPSTK